MPDPYTYLNKPTDSTYTNVNGIGREEYDQADISYDSAITFYDGTDVNAYTDIAKPTGGGVIFSAGMTMGLLIPLTRSTSVTVGSDYTFINKPTT